VFRPLRAEMITIRPHTPLAQHRRQLFAAGVIALLTLLLAPATGRADLITVGSPLSVSATLNTSNNLGYTGVNTSVPPSEEAPNGVIHTPHFGADTAIWNTVVAGGDAAMPQAGQADVIRLEGCALQAPGGPAPLTQIHFQSLSPQPGGGLKVALTSQPFELPICGQNGASGSTISSYEPINLCVNGGDYVGFNDEGGFVEKYYRSGVPYEVLGSVGRSSVASFLKGGGTDNGALFSPLETSAMEGFSSVQNEELMMQVQLGTGANARYVCPGGTKDAPPVLPVIGIGPQTDGINRARIVQVAVYCRPTSGCDGTATLTLSNLGKSAAHEVGKTKFSLPGDNTSHVPIRVSPEVLTLIRRHNGVATTLAAVVDGQTFAQTVEIKIL
jgi:hypothetical protein